MWVSVAEGEKVGVSPTSVSYWGTPVVLFRTGSGQIAALEDQCGHRGIPLSQGVVRGDCIQCPYHHFEFDERGACARIPPHFGPTDDIQKDCTVRSFYVQESRGLVWISIEPPEITPFPVPAAFEGGDDESYITGSFPIRGDIRIWLEHFLDMHHVIFTHAPSAYGGGGTRGLAELESFQVAIDPTSSYPVRNAAVLRVRPPHAFPFRRSLLQAGGLGAYLIQAIRGARRAASHLEAAVDLLTPLSQRLCATFASGFGVFRYDLIVSLVPLARDRSRIVYSFRIPDLDRRGLVWRFFLRRFIAGFIEAHVLVEDGRFLSIAPFVSDFFRLPSDVTVDSIRAMFARYVERKAALYPETSFIHELRDRSGRGALAVVRSERPPLSPN
jgi:nitrite reductase/ring-hydroxylating ferredoxin subunit